MDMHDKPDMRKEKVWGLPIRLFHWLLVVVVSVCWLLGDDMTYVTIQWHFYLGYVTGGLIIFRLLWGMIGPPSARLSDLLPSLGDVVRHTFHLYKREPSGDAGHTPLGALAALAILATLSLTVITGLFAEDDDAPQHTQSGDEIVVEGDEGGAPGGQNRKVEDGCHRRGKNPQVEDRQG